MAAWTTQDLAAQLRGRLALGDACWTGGRRRPFRKGRLQPVEPLSRGTPPDPDAVPFLSPEGLKRLARRSGTHRESLFRSLARSGAPCLLLAVTPAVPSYLRRLSRRYRLPVLASPLEPPLLESRLVGLLREYGEGRKRVQGCLAVAAGAGILVTGESGTGKTAAALCLAKGKGGAWVADDAVDLVRRGGTLRGRAPGVIRGLAAPRGRGIVRASALLSPSRILEEADVDGIVLLARPGEKPAGCPEAGIPGETCRILGLERPFLHLRVEDPEPAGPRIARWAESLRREKGEP